MTDKPNEKSTSIDQASLAKETEEIERAIAEAMGESRRPAQPAVESETEAEAETEVESDVDGAESDVDVVAADETVADEDVADDDAADEPVADEPAAAARPGGRRSRLAKVLAFGVLPVLVLVLVSAAGWLTYLGIATSTIDTARAEAVQTAKDSTAALLTYQPDTVEQQLTDARNLLTGEFKDSYTGMTTDMVIPGAKQQRISAVATVPRAAAVSVDPKRAVVLVFVNQTVSVGEEAPSQSLSSVRVTLEKLEGKWLISKFEPV